MRSKGPSSCKNEPVVAIRSLLAKRLSFLALLLLLLSCDESDTKRRNSSVDFPSKDYPGPHCFMVLTLHLNQISAVTGEGKFGNWVSSDVEEARTAALQNSSDSFSPTTSIEGIQSEIRKIGTAFDSNSDEEIQGRELEGFGRHIDQCMELFYSNEQ